MKNEIVKLDAPELQGLEKSKAAQIKATFEPMAKMLSEFEAQYNELMSIPIEEMTLELTQKYKRLRLDIGKVRIETGKLKDKQKEYIKLEDRAIMGVHNILIWAVTEKEDNLKKREDYFEIQEQKRLELLQSDRAEKLSLYVYDAHERNLSGMDEDVWNAYFQTKKKEHEDKIAAEKKAEQERIAAEKRKQKHIEREFNVRDYGRFFDWDSSHEETTDEDFSILTEKAKAAKKAYEAEQESIRIENAKLKKEAEERERLAKIEADKRAAQEKQRLLKEEAERKAREEKERKEKAEYEAKLKAQKEERERFEREETAKRDKLQAELNSKLEAERKAKQEAELKIQAELSKGDEAKVKDLILELVNLKTKYTFKSAKKQKMYTDVSELIDKVILHINKY